MGPHPLYLLLLPLSIPHTSSLPWPWRPGRPLRLAGPGSSSCYRGSPTDWQPRPLPASTCSGPQHHHAGGPSSLAAPRHPLTRLLLLRPRPPPTSSCPPRVIHASLLCRRVRRCPSSHRSPHGLLYGGAARERHSCRPVVAPLLRPPRLAGVLAATPYHADLSRRRRLVPRRFPALLLWRQCVSPPSATGGTNSGHSHDRAGRSGSHTAYGSSGGTSFAPCRRRSHVQPLLVAAAAVAAVLPQLATAEASREPRMPPASRISRRQCSWSPSRRPLHPAQGEKIECGARSALGRALARAATSSDVSSSLLRVLL